MTTNYNRADESVRYEEVEVEQEILKYVPVKQKHYQERRVPKIITEYRERIVEVPRTHIVEKIVEVPEYVERIKHVPVSKIVEIPREVVQFVPKVEIQVVEKEVEVPGKIIEVKKHVEILNHRTVDQHIDEEVPVVVSQTLQPHILESTTHHQAVKLKKYIPYAVPVEVFVPVAVERDIIPGDKRDETRQVKIPSGQFNGQLRSLNPNLPEENLSNLYQRNQDGSIPMLRANHPCVQLQ